MLVTELLKGLGVDRQLKEVEGSLLHYELLEHGQVDS